jgi:hypothetical protein
MDGRRGEVMLDHVVRNSEDRPMPTPITHTAPFPFSVRRIVACTSCGARRRTLVDTARGLRAHCMGCGAEVAFPFVTEDASHVIGRAGQVVVHG